MVRSWKGQALVAASLCERQYAKRLESVPGGAHWGRPKAALGLRYDRSRPYWEPHGARLGRLRACWAVLGGS
eukprot:2247692-Pyramimonas_sp.AAC.1